MNDAKHTKGPWHRNIRADGKYPVVFSGRNQHVATVSQQKDGAETEANIDLIAAAPDGYELAKMILETNDTIEGPVRQAARRLLAKAEGK